MKHNIGVGIDLDRRFLARPHMGELGLLEIGLHPNVVGRHEREQRRRGVDVIADLKLVDLGDDSVLRRMDFGIG